MDDSLQKEALFLAYQLLNNISLKDSAFKSVTEELEYVLNSSCALGTATTWNGESRTVLVQDMAKKHSRLPEGLLLSHLSSLLQLKAAKNPNSNSLLAIEDSSLDDPILKMETKRISTRLISNISSIASKTVESRKFSARLMEMNRLLSVMCAEDASLRQIGLERERKDVLKKLDTNGLIIDSLREEVVELTNDLRNRGRLSDETYRGKCSSQVSWLQNRCIGNVNSRYKSFKSTTVARNVSASAYEVRSRFTGAYRYQYSTSGHYHCPAYCAVFDRTGRYALTGADDTLVKVWDVERGQLVMTLRGHKGYVTFIAVSPDNSVFASSCTLGDIRVWRLCDGECMCVLKHNGSVNWMKFCELTGALASGGDDGFAYIWDVGRHLPLDKGPFPLIECIMKENSTACESAVTMQASDSMEVTMLSSPVTAQRISHGFFPWSSSLVDDGRLALPHTQLHDSGAMEPVTVLCIDLSPLGDYIATGREDGIANVWKFGYNRGECPGKGSPANAGRSRSAIEGLRGTVSEAEFDMMRSIADHLILRLVGHVAPITDIRFNAKGDRLITGSLKEGAVRIWSFSNDFTRCDHIVLSMNEDGEVVNNSTLRRQRNVRSKNQLYSLSWSIDDLFIFTLQSGTPLIDAHPTKFKMWDGLTGSLLKMIEVGDSQIKVLALHPLDSNVFAAVGDEGVVTVWNTFLGKKTFEFKVVCPPNIPDINANAPVNVLDAAFSADGSRLIVTDHLGRLLVFGLQDPDRYLHIPTEQYFSTDYNDFYNDDGGIAIDVGTHMPVHLTPARYLCRMDGTSYGFTVVDQATHNATITVNQVSTELAKRRAWAAMQSRQLDSSHRHFKRVKNKMALYQPSHVVTVQPERRPAPSRVSYKSERPEDAIAAPFTFSDNDSDDGDWVSIESSDGETMFRRRSRMTRRAEGAVHTRSSRRSQRSNSPAQQSQRLRRVVIDSDEDEDDGFVQSDDDDDGRATRRAHRERARARAAVEVAPTQQRARRIPVHREPSLRTCWPRAGGIRSVPPDVVINREWAVAEEASDYQYCPQVGDTVMYFVQGHAQHLSSIHETAQPPWTNFPGRWQAVECRVTGVHYNLPTQAEHRVCNSVVATVALTIIGTPMHASGASSHHLLTDFSSTSTRRSHLDRAEYCNFTVTLRKGMDLSDFLVPAYLYYRAAVIRWRPGMRLQCPFLEASGLTVYTGLILEIADYDPAYPHSPWECLKVKWDGSEEENTVGPWDAFLIEDASSAAILASLQQPKYQAPSLDEGAKQHLDELICQFLEDPVYEPFAFHIDTAVYADYLCVVPVPMHLDLIHVRNQNGYYRSLDSVKADINMIYSNCILYNTDGADIVHLAGELVTRLLSSEPFSSAAPIETVPDETDHAVQSTSSRARRALEEPAEAQPVVRSRSKRRFDSTVGPVDPQPHADIAAVHDSAPTRSRRHASSKSTKSSEVTGRSQRATRSNFNYADLEGSDVDVPSSGESEEDEDEDEEDSVTVPEKKRSSRTRRESGRLSSSLIESGTEGVRSRRSSRLSSSQKVVEDDDGESDDSELSELKPKQRRHMRLRASTQEEESDLVIRIKRRPTDGASIPTVVGKRLDPELKHNLRDLLDAMESLDAEGVFAQPVTEDIAPGYFTYIEVPMDLSTIRSKLTHRQYESVDDMAQDMRIMYNNCMAYNDHRSSLYREAHRHNEYLGAYLSARS